MYVFIIVCQNRVRDRTKHDSCALHGFAMYVLVFFPLFCSDIPGGLRYILNIRFWEVDCAIVLWCCQLYPTVWRWEFCVTICLLMDTGSYQLLAGEPGRIPPVRHTYASEFENTEKSSEHRLMLMMMTVVLQ